jgi:hypothetical protein
MMITDNSKVNVALLEENGMLLDQLAIANASKERFRELLTRLSLAVCEFNECEQDTDEMDKCFAECLEQAITAIGRVDS